MKIYENEYEFDEQSDFVEYHSYIGYILLKRFAFVLPQDRRTLFMFELYDSDIFSTKQPFNEKILYRDEN